MDNEHKQRVNIILSKETINGQDSIRVDYANNPAISLLLSEDTDVKISQDGCAYISASVFKLPVFYERYSPHAYIDYSRVYVRHPKPKRDYILPKGYLELLEQKR